MLIDEGFLHGASACRLGMWKHWIFESFELVLSPSTALALYCPSIAAHTSW